MYVLLAMYALVSVIMCYVLLAMCALVNDCYAFCTSAHITHYALVNNNLCIYISQFSLRIKHGYTYAFRTVLLNMCTYCFIGSLRRTRPHWTPRRPWSQGIYERLVYNDAVHSVVPNSIRECVDLPAQLDHEAVLEQV